VVWKSGKEGEKRQREGEEPEQEAGAENRERNGAGKAGGPLQDYFQAGNKKSQWRRKGTERGVVLLPL